MSVPEKVTTVLIGCGARGVGKHGVLAKNSSKLELVAVCDIDETRLRAASETLGVPGEPELRRILDRKDVDSVIIATSAKSHAAIARAAIQAGKHVLLEKPLADTAEASFQLAEAIEASGLIGIVGYQARFSPFSLALKQEVEIIQPVQLLITRQRQPMAQQYFFPEHYGGVVDTATHEIHLALWLMGGEPETAYGAVSRGSILGDETIEYMNLIVEYDGGRRTATVLSSMFGINTPNVIQIIGQRGSVVSLDRKTLKVVSHGGIPKPGIRPVLPPDLATRIVELPAETEDPTGAMLEHFADRITGRVTKQLGATFREGAYAIAASEAMVEAAETGSRVRLQIK
ncbi:MAG TPA: Gfo/Idh/MocA family oxidoreductase [Chloroflexota bacterium]|jgi:predicted dehydrogenase|nr:Gfo/Idh/MocA family oxidoreductase [Chloroflexota bacterium]